MYSGTVVYVACLMLLNCWMVTAKPSECYSVTTRSDIEADEIDREKCVARQTICSIEARYLLDGQFDIYKQRCSDALPFPPREDLFPSLTINDGGDNITCSYYKEISNIYIMCTCLTNLCNKIDSPIHKKFLEMIKITTGADFKLTFPGLAEIEEAMKSNRTLKSFANIEDLFNPQNTNKTKITSVPTTTVKAVN